MHRNAQQKAPGSTCAEGENIDQRDLVAFLIRPDRIVQLHVLARLLQAAQMHQNLDSNVKRVRSQDANKSK
jgi:hypothetical protein